MSLARREYPCVIDASDSLTVETATDRRGVEFTILDEGEARGAVLSWADAKRLRDQIDVALRARDATAHPSRIVQPGSVDSTDDAALKLGM